MLKKRYYLQLEFSCKNHIILALNEDYGDGREIVGYLYLEDFRRAGTPEDFKEFHPVYLEDWDDYRNLIVARVVTYKDLSAEEEEELLCLAETFIEFKPAVNIKVEFHVLKELNELFTQCAEENSYLGGSYLPILQLLIDNFGGNPISLEKLTIDSLNYLSQE